MSEEDYDPQQLAHRVSKDPLLCAKLLAVANCTLRNSDRQSLSIERAIICLGYTLTQSVIVSYQLETSVAQSNGLPPKHFSYVRRWAAAASVLARTFAKRANLVDPGLLGTAALFSRLGSLLLGMGAPKPTEEYANKSNEITRLQFEADKWGITTPIISGQMVRHWGFPDPLPDMLEQQFDPLFGEVGNTQMERQLLILAVSLILGANLIARRVVEPLTLLERSTYEILLDNLKTHELLKKILQTYREPRLEQELHAAVAET